MLVFRNAFWRQKALPIAVRYSSALDAVIGDRRMVKKLVHTFDI